MSLDLIVGPEAAAKLRHALGGRSYRVPGWHATAAPGRVKLIRLIGPEAAELLITECGLTRIYVPTGSADFLTADRRQFLAREVRRLTRRGWSAGRIAERLRCSERAVYRQRRIARENHP